MRAAINLVSRTRCSVQRCCAEPGPTRMRIRAPDQQRTANALRCIRGTRASDLPDGRISLRDFGAWRPRAPRKSRQKRLRRKTHFACAFKSILGATPIAAKISLYENQKSCIYCSHPASIGGAYASSRTLRRDAVDANGSHDERRVSGRLNRVVPAPRRWCQACEMTFTQATVAKKPGTPGRARR